MIASRLVRQERRSLAARSHCPPSRRLVISRQCPVFRDRVSSCHESLLRLACGQYQRARRLIQAGCSVSHTTAAPILTGQWRAFAPRCRQPCPTRPTPRHDRLHAWGSRTDGSCAQAHRRPTRFLQAGIRAFLDVPPLLPRSRSGEIGFMPTRHEAARLRPRVVSNSAWGGIWGPARSSLRPYRRAVRPLSCRRTRALISAPFSRQT